MSNKFFLPTNLTAKKLRQMLEGVPDDAVIGQEQIKDGYFAENQKWQEWEPTTFDVYNGCGDWITGEFIPCSSGWYDSKHNVFLITPHY